MPIANRPPPNPATNGPVSEHLQSSTSDSVLDLSKVDAPLEPWKDIECGMSHGDTIKSRSGLVLGAEGSIPSRERCVSQPAQPLITELTTHDEDTDNQDEDDDDSDASRESQEVMALRRKLRHIQFGEPHDETFDAMVLLAMELKREKHGRAGRLEAEQLLTPALGFYRAELGTTHPKTRPAMRLLADVWFELGKIRQATSLGQTFQNRRRGHVWSRIQERKGVFLQDNVAITMTKSA
jgi:hypothetical protein